MVRNDAFIFVLHGETLKKLKTWEGVFQCLGRIGLDKGYKGLCSKKHANNIARQICSMWKCPLKPIGSDCSLWDDHSAEGAEAFLNHLTWLWHGASSQPLHRFMQCNVMGRRMFGIIKLKLGSSATGCWVLFSDFVQPASFHVNSASLLKLEDSLCVLLEGKVCSA